MFFSVQLIALWTHFVWSLLTNLLSELICVRDDLCDTAINFTEEELLSIIDNVCTS